MPTNLATAAAGTTGRIGTILILTMGNAPDLDAVAVFVQVGQLQSFTAAAKRLGLSRSQVSKQIAALEDRLKTQLLHRTTRTVRLTETGSAYHARCAAILAELVEAERSVTQLQSTPSGRLRINAPMSFGQLHLAAAIGDFMTLYPALQVELELSDRLVDVIDEGFDLAVRITALADSSLIARKLASSPRFVCASPGYLEQHGPLENPEQLAAHACLTYSYQTTGESWHFRSADRERVVRVGGRLRCNNGDVLAEAACRGVGVALLPAFIATPALQAGRLVRVLGAWEAPATNVYAVYPSSRHLSVKVRTMIDYLVEYFGRPSWLVA